MASSATVNDTLRIRAKFYTWDDVEDENVTEDPVTVVFTITDNEAASPGVLSTPLQLVHLRVFTTMIGLPALRVLIL